MSSNNKKDIKPEDLGTGLLSKAAQALVDRKKRQQEMNKRLGIKPEKKPNSNN